MNIRNIVAFCVLMENGEGILGKSPAYIEEKFKRYCVDENDGWQWGLDQPNSEKIADWIMRWERTKPK